MKIKLLLMGAGTFFAGAIAVLYHHVDTRESGPEPLSQALPQQHEVATAINAESDRNALPSSDKKDGIVPPAETQSADLLDEKTLSELLRQEATNEVRSSYALLLKQLGLGAAKEKALIAFLIEDRISNSSTDFVEAHPLDKATRAARITALIGSDEQAKFMTLEQDIKSYAAVENIKGLLQINGHPLNDSQVDGLLEIFKSTHAAEDDSAEQLLRSKPKNIEDLESVLAQRNEYERKILDRAGAVISSKQMQYVFEWYQYLSDKRASALEEQKKRLAKNPKGRFFATYPAG
jgi:hypothetical protein